MIIKRSESSRNVACLLEAMHIGNHLRIEVSDLEYWSFHTMILGLHLLQFCKPVVEPETNTNLMIKWLESSNI